jgi:hypothetical protein
MAEPTLSQQFLGFGAAAERDGGTTYGAICRSAAQDPALLAIIAEAPLAQRRPNLLLAAVHYLLLGGTDHPLGDFYDTVRLEGTPPPDGDVGPVFRDFCLSHSDQLFELVATRSTQTNEVGRCSVLLPSFCAIAQSYGGLEPLALLDVGTSAGLTLNFDRYRYTYHQSDDGRVLEAGDTASPVALDCAMRSTLDDLPTLSFPTIVDRRGLDLSPVDASSEDEALWLLACLWPDALVRFGRLKAALELWRSTADRPELVQGDMVDDLGGVAALLAGDGPLVVFHTWAAAYLSEERQRELVRAVRALGATRPIHHLYAELPFETPGLPTPEPPVELPNARAATALVHIGPGGVPERWGSVHPHGTWMRWLATPTGPTARPDAPGPAGHRA